MKLRITLEGQSYDVDVEVLPTPGDEPMEFESAMSIPASVLQPPPPPDIRAEDRVCRSPIAGVIVSVIARPHQKLKQDDPVAVIEAMKMQTTIGAPVEGTVEEIQVVPGESVKPGQLICTLT